jgi:hypothetical protein
MGRLVKTNSGLKVIPEVGTTCAGNSPQMAHKHVVHAAVGHPARSEIVAVPGAARAEEGTALDAGGFDVFGDGLRRAWTTEVGGTGRPAYGTIFELLPNGEEGWTETVLYSFCSAAGCADGASPYS